jgi:hypothetical protein
MTGARIPRAAFLALALLPLGGLGAAVVTHLDASPASARSASVRDVRSGLLRATDLPAGSGLSGPQVKVYTGFTAAMKATGNSCSQSPAMRASWRQGVIETFTGSSFSVLTLCANRFAAPDGAHAAYAAEVAAGASTVKNWKIVSSRVGDESLAVVGSQAGGAGPWSRGYVGIFRHSNVVESILYVGDSRLTWSQFERLESLVDARLR